MRNSERNIDVLTFMFVFIICILMSSLQSFDTLLPYITIKCISPPSQTPCVVYMKVLGSAFFIKSKLLACIVGRVVSALAAYC